MPIDPKIKMMTLVTTNSLGADATYSFGPFANAITIRRFIENSSAITTGTTALDVNDTGAGGAGTTAIADKTAGAFGTAFLGIVTEALNVGGADGYKLAAGNGMSVGIDWTTPAVLGYSLVMEYVDGIG